MGFILHSTNLDTYGERTDFRSTVFICHVTWSDSDLLPSWILKYFFASSLAAAASSRLHASFINLNMHIIHPTTLLRINKHCGETGFPFNKFVRVVPVTFTLICFFHECWNAVSIFPLQPPLGYTHQLLQSIYKNLTRLLICSTISIRTRLTSFYSIRIYPSSNWDCLFPYDYWIEVRDSSQWIAKRWIFPQANTSTGPRNVFRNLLANRPSNLSNQD